MSVSVSVVAGSSGGSTTTVKPDLHQVPSCTRGAAGCRVSFRSLSTGGAPPWNRWGTLLRSSSFASSFRARAAVKDGVAAGSGRKSFYELLGIPKEGTTAEIKRAYKEMALRYHPDVCPSPDRTEEYTRRFIEVHEAYETLSDPGLRARYDCDLARGLHLAFSARRRAPHSSYHDEEFEYKSQWRNRWQDQVSELKRRNMNRNSGNNISWGAQMRKQREESSAE